jgi:hypothetical protein
MSKFEAWTVSHNKRLLAVFTRVLVNDYEHTREAVAKAVAAYSAPDDNGSSYHNNKWDNEVGRDLSLWMLHYVYTTGRIMSHFKHCFIKAFNKHNDMPKVEPYTLDMYHDGIKMALLEIGKLVRGLTPAGEERQGDLDALRTRMDALGTLIMPIAAVYADSLEVLLRTHSLRNVQIIESKV